MLKILIVQTAFIGDVILATPLLEKLHRHYPTAKIDFLLRKGNEDLLNGHPYLSKIYIWDKKSNKYKNLFSLLRQVRKEGYDFTINLQRFLSTGLLTAFSKSKTRIGFSKNPVSFLFDKKIAHKIGSGTHEVERNIALIEDITDNHIQRPVLYPTPSDFESVQKYKNSPYICLAPASVWQTKQLPLEKWIELGKSISSEYTLIFLGARGDWDLCNQIQKEIDRKNSLNLSGELNLLQSAALMKDAAMNYVNDSAPMHLASSVNGPTTAFFCSTTPEFGFGPLADQSIVAQIDYKLYCRPCGIHGRKTCPEGHFRCAHDIKIKDFRV
jgi:lipopolysaccharide heptosyltransferase II